MIAFTFCWLFCALKICQSALWERERLYEGVNNCFDDRNLVYGFDLCHRRRHKDSRVLYPRKIRHQNSKVICLHRRPISSSFSNEKEILESTNKNTWDTRRFTWSVFIYRMLLYRFLRRLKISFFVSPLTLGKHEIPNTEFSFRIPFAISWREKNTILHLKTSILTKEETKAFKALRSIYVARNFVLLKPKQKNFFHFYVLSSVSCFSHERKADIHKLCNVFRLMWKAYNVP